MLNKEKQQEFIKEYQFLSIHDLSEKYGISYQEIRYYANKLGLKKKIKVRITDMQLRFIKENIDLTTGALAAATKLDWHTVYNLKKKILAGKEIC